MRISSIILTLGIITLGFVLTPGGNSWAQAPGGFEFAVNIGSVAGGTGSGLQAAVPVVPVGGKRYRGRHGGWKHWSAPYYRFNYGYPSVYGPKYRYGNWGYGPGFYTCWSDGWRTYCGYY